MGIAMLKLIEYINNLIERLKGIKMAKLTETSQKDVAEARASHIELVKMGDKTATHFIYFYSWFWAIASVVYFFSVTFMPMPDGARDFANIILGFLLGTAVATIIGFFYGNSDGGE
jgi:hypothetical protein